VTRQSPSEAAPPSGPMTSGKIILAAAKSWGFLSGAQSFEFAGRGKKIRVAGRAPSQWAWLPGPREEASAS
jgi:hypothetical protein